MNKKIRKGSLAGILLFIFLCIAFKVSLPFIAGASKFEAQDLEKGLSKSAKALIQSAYNPIKHPADYHVHLLGSDQTPEAFLNPAFLSWMHPMNRIRYTIFMHASRVFTPENSYVEYTDRLLNLVNHAPQTSYYVFAFAPFYDNNGVIQLEHTDFYVSNKKMFELIQKNPERLKPVISVHPYDPKAIEALKFWHQKGVRFIKWLPNAMNIDPSSDRIIPFYEAVKALDMVIITHVGKELAVSSEIQAFGNPLKYRKALDRGVKIVMAHAATYGMCDDLDLDSQPEVPCFDLFVRLMNEKKYNKNLFADVSSILLFNRDPEVIQTLLEQTHWHSRLFNGSDYPLPAVNVVIHLSTLQKNGFLSGEEVEALRDIYQYNPLVFDFVLKRTIKHPETKQGFRTIVFEERTL